MIQLSCLILLNGEGSSQPGEVASAILLSLYAFSGLCILGGIIFAAKALRMRRRVMTKHAVEMIILEDWERAKRYAYSGDDNKIVTGLDIIWANSTPFAYAEVQPVISLFVNHSNKNISQRAERILTKMLSQLTPPPE